MVAQFPGFIKRQFEETFYISHRGGLDREAKFVVDSLAVKGFGFSKSIKLVTLCHAREFHNTKELYYLHQESLQQTEKGSIRSFFKKVAAPSTSSAAAQALPSSGQSLPSSSLSAPSAPSASSEVASQSSARQDRFGKFREPGGGYRIYIPGAGYWITAYLEDFKGREKWLQRQLEHTDGEFLRSDHTFQVWCISSLKKSRRFLFFPIR